MPSLMGALLGASQVLRSYERSLSVAQNNVANATTPGYVKQRQLLIPMAFDPERELPGGVLPGPLLDSRTALLEQNVWRRQQEAGTLAQSAEELGRLEAQFDLAAGHGVPAALNRFFASFSQLSVNPNDEVSRLAVLDQARETAQAFRSTAGEFAQADANSRTQTRNTVDRINALVGKLRELNATRRNNGTVSDDPGLDATAYAALEELAEFADVAGLKQADGTFSLYLGGQTPLLIGTNQYAISADVSTTQTVIRDALSNDITAQVGGGRLKGLITLRNQTLPGYTAALHRLAKGFADELNTQLSLGVDRSGVPPAKPLFTYDEDIGAAFTLQVTDLTPDQIAAAQQGAPGGNGNALTIARMGERETIDGFTFAEYFGNLGGRVGRDLANARQSLDLQQRTLAQARALRAEATGVSLDEEAVYVLQAQRGYQAAAKLVTVLDELTETVLGLMR
jgi:flagellar hook-associated protein 1